MSAEHDTNEDQAVTQQTTDVEQNTDKNELVDNVVDGVLDDVHAHKSAENKLNKIANDVSSSVIDTPPTPQDFGEPNSAQEVVQDLNELPISNELAGMVFFGFELARAGVLQEDRTFEMLRHFYFLDTGKHLLPTQIQAFLSHRKITDYTNSISGNIKIAHERREKLKFENLEKNLKELGATFDTS